MKFQNDFVWGAASSSYQIEGGATEDGKGPSIWDMFCKIDGAIAGGHTGDIACDSYHRYREDIALMAQLNIKHYRFSISWPRVIPNGTGEINPAGLAYYDGLVDCCLSHGITPWITLFHWDLPANLPGGWENRETAVAFANYAKIITAHFKGRVTNYFTLNEPQCAVGLGYDTGVYAPGKKLPLPQVFTCWKNMLLANGLAIRAMRQVDRNAKIGIASTGDLCYPETEDDVEGARAFSFGDQWGRWNFTHHWFLDPICLGRFPQTKNQELAAQANAVSPEDMAIIKADMDILGVNLYHGHAVTTQNGMPELVKKAPGFPRTALKWPITPEALRWGPKYLCDRYQLPLYITENGLSCNDKVYLDGQVHDPDRIDYLHRYLQQLSLACQEGTPVCGYFQWSFTDNFEWASGYDERFGLVFVDYETQRRIPKDSARWYSNFIAQMGAEQ